jgi:hypothetical protein
MERSQSERDLQLLDFSVELHQMADEIKSLSAHPKGFSSVSPDPAPDLAEAVVAFAEWQQTGYIAGRSRDSSDAISRQLWWVIQENVRSITGKEAIYPGPRPENNAAE